MKKDYELKCIFCGKSPIAVRGGKKAKKRCMTCGRLQNKRDKE